MWPWLAKIDPNIAIPFVIGGITWLYHKAMGKKQADHRSIVDSVFETFAHELLDHYTGGDIASYLKTARSYIDARLWSVLAKRGIPKNALTKRLTDEAIERWSAWLGAQLLPLRKDGPLSTVLK